MSLLIPEASGAGGSVPLLGPLSLARVPEAASLLPTPLTPARAGTALIPRSGRDPGCRSTPYPPPRPLPAPCLLSASLAQWCRFPQLLPETLKGAFQLHSCTAGGATRRRVPFNKGSGSAVSWPVPMLTVATLTVFPLFVQFLPESRSSQLDGSLFFSPWPCIPLPPIQLQ